jgi:hypothetical protein
MFISVGRGLSKIASEKKIGSNHGDPDFRLMNRPLEETVNLKKAPTNRLHFKSVIVVKFWRN